MNYLKVMFQENSSYKNFKYKINEVTNAPNWNPNAKTPKEMGGLNYSNEENIIRWLHNGDTIYDVEVPEDAEVINVQESATPNGVFRSNKIIVKNPRKVTDEMALDFYRKSTIPESAYPKALGGVSIMNYYNTAIKIFNDKVTINNIDYFLDEWNDFISKKDRKDCNETVRYIDKKLKEFKNSNNQSKS